MGRLRLMDLLAEARAIVGEEGYAVTLVLWRLRQARPGDEAARATMAGVLVVESLPPEDRADREGDARGPRASR